ncbi:MAG: IstB-like binding protein [Vampirovibrio sp.]|jgi:DNA replication protein DnaC|nr:IstB-like binding protein [Vampirovibrio sp.]
MNPHEYMKLKAVPEAERAAYLQSIGFTPDGAADLLASLAASMPKPKEDRTETGAAVLAKHRIPERIAELAAKANAGQDETLTDEDKYRRDILLNRYLMGGSSIYDEASLYNPALQETDVLRWLKAMRPRVALVIGSPGSGKTWGTLAYMNSLTTARGNGSKVEWSDSLFIPAFRLSEMFHNQKKFQSELDEILKKKHLLIDDLGAEPSGFRGSDFIAYFDYLFSERHKFRRCTFLTSNAKTTEEIRSIYGERFASRFSEVGCFYETAQGDLRRS